MTFEFDITEGGEKGREGRPPNEVWLTRSITEGAVGNWLALATRGVVSVTFGVVALCWTGITAVVLSVLLSAYLLTSGAFALIGGSDGHSWPMMLDGAISIFAGIILLGWTGVSSLTPTLFVAGWAVVAGAVQLWGAFLVPEPVAHAWPLLLTGLASVTLAIVLAVYKWVELEASFALIGEYTVICGALALTMAGMFARHAFALRHAGISSDRAGKL